MSIDFEFVERPYVIHPELVAVAGDLVVGALLSQIVYWHLPSADGSSKLKVKRAGHLWVAKTREAWVAETCLTMKQYKRAIRVLRAKGLVEVRTMLFAGIAMTHLRLNVEALQSALAKAACALELPDSVDAAASDVDAGIS